MFDDSRIFARRSFLGTCVVAGAAAMVGLINRDVAAMQGKNTDNFAFGRTDENGLSAEDASLPRRARDLIRVGNVGIAKEDQATLTAFFHPQFRFHGPGGAELNREQLWEYFAACRAAFDDFTVTRQTLVSDGDDYIAARTRFAGVFARPFTGAAGGPIEPNGKPVEYRLGNIFRYASNGQLVEEWVHYDIGAFLAQLRS